ncbi:MAG: hypothetical protein LV481_07615, partial [Methylacidiphilales bacterium]|nr:hypothetical protein [Candidatus Methylacidiphilales bacterium]
MLITLISLALVTVLVIAFLGLASQDLKSTNFFVRSEQADQIARGGLDFVVGNLRGEVQDSSLSSQNGSGQSPFYVPLYGTNVFPLRAVPLANLSTNAAWTNILLTSANSAFYNVGQAPSTMNSTIPSTNISFNNQMITASDWNKPMLVPYSQQANIPIPNWVFVGRNGPVTNITSSAQSSAYNPSLTNANAVIGRYAFVVYDTSGLLDINVAGYDTNQPSMATNASGKGLLPYADLTQLSPGIITTSDVSALVQFRNAVSETNFPLALTNNNGFGLESNGFMHVYATSTNGTSDSTFLSRQEFIQYATNNPDWTNALPYLTTFSRELNGPTWGTTMTNCNYTMPVSGSNYIFNYQTQATSTATNVYNPDIYAVKVQQSFTRDNGTNAVVGEPLAKYRFPLDKLNLLEKQGTAGTGGNLNLSTSDQQLVQKYFGLDLVSDSNGLYRHWQYPTTNTSYPHTVGQILTLAQVAAQSPAREPDFFELLQAGILNGSLGGWGRGDNPPYASYGTAYDPDKLTSLQILRIGANIIDQWDTDSYPTTISFLLDSNNDTYNVYGIQDLPYITQMFTKAYSPSGTQTTPIYPYIYFQIWNPHQAPSALVYNSANYPSKFRIAPYYNLNNPAASDNYDFQIVIETSGTYRWAYNSSTMSWLGGGTDYYFSSVGTLSGGLGGGAETSRGGLQFTFNPLTDYREPGLVVGTPNPASPWTPTIPSGGGQPSGQQLAAISLPEISSLPPNGMLSSSSIVTGTNPSTIAWSTTTMDSEWYVKFSTQTVFLLQFQDSNGVWQTYGTFEGLDTQSLVANPYTGWDVGGFIIPTSSASTDDVSWAKSDPRTYRFGPGAVWQNQSGFTVGTVATNSTHGALLTPTSLAWPIWSQMPFEDGQSSFTYPYRMDYWVANNPAKPVPTPSFSVNNGPYYWDLDGIQRGGDSAYAYSAGGSAWGSDPVLPGTAYQTAALPARPVMLHHPFNSVGDLGYAFRDDPWRTLDFMTPGSADAGLLDLFTLSEAPVVAGRINPNTPYTQVIASLVSGATQSSATSVSGATTNVPSSTAQLVGTNFVSFTSTNPITNRAALVTSGAVSNIINGGAFTDSGTSMVKTEGESVVRSLAESSNTRTWNFL